MKVVNDIMDNVLTLSTSLKLQFRNNFIMQQMFPKSNILISVMVADKYQQMKVFNPL